MDSLFTRHPLVLATAYSDLKRQADEQPFLLIGTPGSVSAREVNGSLFLYRQFYDAQGSKASDYLGSAKDPQTQSRANAIREEIAVTNGLLETTRLLARQGYVRVDARTGSIVTALANRGLFRGGAIVVGSHAYGALLNELGVRAAAYSTEDVDIARNEPLELATGRGDFAEMLAESTVPLSPVLGFDRKVPPTSYKTPGRDRLRVDLLVPTRGRGVSVKAVPELSAHATALPHLGYLLRDPMAGLLLGRESVVPIRVPRPERLAWHKMLVSQLRQASSDKKSKDLHQAAVLFAALAEDDPDALSRAHRDIEQKAKTRAGARLVLARLEKSPHSRAFDLLTDLV